MHFSFLAIMLMAVCRQQCASSWVVRPTMSQIAKRKQFGYTSSKTISSTAASRVLATTNEESVSTTATANRDNFGRLSRQDFSVDLRTVTAELPTVISHLQARRAAAETIQAAEQIASLAGKRLSLIKERDAWLNQRKEASAAAGSLLRREADLNDAERIELQQAKDASALASDNADKADAELTEIQTTMDTLLAGIPNLLDDIVPDGSDDKENEEVYKWGDPTALAKRFDWPDDFEPYWHDDVATKLKGYEAEAAVRISGARFVALSGVVAQLERALIMFFMDLHTTKHGYREVSVPYVVSRSALEGTSQLPKFQQDLFAISPESHTCSGEDAFLIPTAEVPVTNLHRDQVLEESDLPLSYVSFTPCFRAEAGSHGRDTKGLIRTHQFLKVELVKITTAETSNDEHEILTKHAEACLQALELPYRKVRLCSGDIGFAARHCYDLEVWLPGAKEYREISSCSNCGDFQARRMGLRYRPKASQEDNSSGKPRKSVKKVKPQLCHTINGSGLAVGRTLVAVLENYQQPDGTVVVPNVLRPYMGGKEKLEVP